MVAECWWSRFRSTCRYLVHSGKMLHIKASYRVSVMGEGSCFTMGEIGCEHRIFLDGNRCIAGNTKGQKDIAYE